MRALWDPLGGWLERIEGELENAFDVEDAMYEAFVRAHRDRPDDFAPV
jgi:hypothetical protein